MSFLKRLVDFLAPARLPPGRRRPRLDTLRQDAARRPAPLAHRRPRPRAAPPDPALGGRGPRPRPPAAQVRHEHGRARARRAGHPGRRELPRGAPPEALRPHEGPALQPLRPDPQGGGRPEGRRQDHLLPAPARHGAGPGPPEGVPGALAPAEGRVRRPGAEPDEGAGLRRARALADPRGGEGRQARAGLERRRAGHHERAPQGDPRGQEDGLPAGGRGRALRRGERRPWLLRGQGLAHQEPLRRQERLPDA